MVERLPSVQKEPRAIWRGREFRAFPAVRQIAGHVLLAPLPGEEAPSDFAYIPEWGGVAKEVHKDDLEAWWTSQWHFTWQGVQFVLWEVGDDTLLGRTSQCSEGWARQHGLFPVDDGAFVGEFPRRDAADLHENRTDLLAEWRRAGSFGG